MAADALITLQKGAPFSLKFDINGDWGRQYNYFNVIIDFQLNFVLNVENFDD